MELYNKLVNWFMCKLVLLFKSKVRIIYTNNKKYLLRVYLKRSGKYLPGIYLHRFYASDEDRFCHNHPWKIAFSLILSGKYKEEKLREDKKTSYFKNFFPGKINIIRDKDFHRIHMVKEPIWTLFVSKNRHQIWGYWDTENQKFIPWDEYTSTNNNYVTDLDGNPRELYE